jgi:C2 domain
MATITQSPDAVVIDKPDKPAATNGAKVEEPKNLDTDGNAADKSQEELQVEHDAVAKEETDEKDAAAKETKDAMNVANSNGTPSSPADKQTQGSKKPKGGFDATPIPGAPSGYTIKITIHRAQNLPMADLNSLSSDPYVITQMYTPNITRHKEDPPLRMRTFTVRRDVNPEWNAEWIVGNVPASGFKLKCRIYDEDPADHDDRLGNAHILVPSLDESWQGIQEQSFKVKKRMGSKRAYLVQALATGVRIRKHMDGHLVLSIKMLGKTESEHGGRVYTVGPMWWTRHYSPLLGRFVGRKTPGKQGEDGDEEPGKPKAERYKYVALSPT